MAKRTEETRRPGNPDRSGEVERTAVEGRELFAAVIDDGSEDDEGRSVDCTFYTGVAVQRMDYWTGEKYMLTMSMDPAHVDLSRLNSGAPLLNSHQSYTLANQIGVVTKGWLEKGTGKATVKFSQRPDVEPFWQDVKNKIIRNISMGVLIGKLEDTTEKGDAMKSYLAVAWQPFEISAVPVGADAGAGFLSHQEIISPRHRVPTPNVVALNAARRRELEILSLR